MTSEYDANDPRLIEAARESGLAAEYAEDPILLRLYMVKLLKWGWAGQKQPTESRYITLARKAMGKEPPGGLRHNPNAQAKSTEKCSQKCLSPNPASDTSCVPTVHEQEVLLT